MSTDKRKKLEGLLKRFLPQAIRRRERSWIRAIEKTESLRPILTKQFMLGELAGLMKFELHCSALPEPEGRRLSVEVAEALKHAAASSPFKDELAKILDLMSLG